MDMISTQCFKLLLHSSLPFPLLSANGERLWKGLTYSKGFCCYANTYLVNAKQAINKPKNSGLKVWFSSSEVCVGSCQKLLSSLDSSVVHHTGQPIGVSKWNEVYLVALFWLLEHFETVYLSSSSKLVLKMGFIFIFLHFLFSLPEISKVTPALQHHISTKRQSFHWGIKVSVLLSQVRKG